MEHRFLDKSNQRREALNIHNPVQVERSDTQLVTDGAGRAYAEQGRATACCLLLLLLWPAILSAQTSNGVTLGNLVVNTGSPSTVTFNVSWKNTGMPTVWSDTVWVFVDHNEGGTMKRLELLSAGATLTATSAPGVGKVEQLAGNHTGVRVIGNARSAGSFSATVQLLTTTANVAGACVYASNYPPVGEYVAGTSAMSFTGTPMYKIVLRPASGSTFTANSDGLYTIQAGDTIKSFTDKTGAPGIIKCIPMTGSLNFSVPSTVQKGQSTSFAVSVQPAVPAPSAITYTWSAQGFSPNTYTGTTFNTTAPAAANTYPVTLTARSEGYCDLPVTNNVTVIDCVTPTTYNLIASASGFCASDAGITFSLDDTQTGVKYQLYRGSDKVGSELTGTGSGAATFTTGVPLKVAGVYTAKSVAESGYCAMLMTGSHPITANATPTAPIISQPGDVCYNAGDLVFTITSYSGTPTWVNNGGGTENGLSVTFASGASTGTKTVIAKSSQTYTNAQTCYSAEVTQTGTINALPAVTGSSGDSRCGSGAVTFSASVPEGVTIDWYNAASAGSTVSGGYGVTSFAPSLTTSTTYYAQARHTSTNCVSAPRTAVGATVHTAPTAPTGLSSNVSKICNGVSTSATLTAEGGNLGSGAEYQWGKGTVGSELLTTTSGNTYSVSPNAAITYWVRLKGTTSCTDATDGQTVSIGVHGAISPGSITTATATTNAGTAPAVTTIASKEAASGGSENLAYEWRRSGVSTGSSALNYNITSSDYSTAGTYYFNRYAKDNTCTGYTAVAAYGTYTLGVISTGPGTITSSTLCVQCCYNGSAWVDCYVSSVADPGMSMWNATLHYYEGASGSGSDKNGKLNTMNVMSTAGYEPPTYSPFIKCSSFGPGWFVPAYEELYAMSAGAANIASNNRDGQSLLVGITWSSTENTGNLGRFDQPGWEASAVIVHTSGLLARGRKSMEYRVVCAWRP